MKFIFTLMLMALPPAAAAQTNVTVNPQTTYQTIRDFGASDCWTADFVGKHFPDRQKENAARWLFSQQMDAGGNPEGIGLSAWRVNLGAGSAEQGDGSDIPDKTRRGHCFLNADGTYDWTKAEGQQYFMAQARKYGVDHFVLFTNSAPVYFTKNGLAHAGAGVRGSNLKDECYADFAKFLATTTKHFVDEGYNISFISPVNEPQYNWTDGQEGSPWTNECIARLVRHIDAALEGYGLQQKILIPEACQWNALIKEGTEQRANNQVEAFFNPANTNTYIGNLPHLGKAIAGHSYWTFGNNADLKNIRTSVAEKAAKYGLDVYQTEWSMLDKAPSADAGFPASYDAAGHMDIALYMAKLIHCDLVYGNMASWSYWTAMAQERWSQKNRFYLLRLNAKGDNGNESYGDLAEGGRITADMNLWVLGNYSRFIRPGFKRIDMAIDDTDLNGLMGSAYLSPDGNRIVMVFVNMGSVRRIVPNVVGISDAHSVKCYETYELSTQKGTLTLNKNTSYAPQRLGGQFRIRKNSVTTMVIDIDQTDGIKGTSAAMPANDKGVYAINGRKVSSGNSADCLPKGLYIVNGVKVLKR
jgi:O-glycosyl hydrolase